MDISCPFSPAEDDVITHVIPVHLREKIVEFWFRREALLHFPKPASIAECGAWYRAIRPVTKAMGEIERELRELVGAPVQSCVEYYADWKFRCPDYNTLHAEYMARVQKK